MAVGLKARNKYNASKVVADGYCFDSKGEHARYCELKLLERAGQIRDLEVHVTYPIEVNGQRVCIYEADFRYFDVQRGTVVVEDFKGVRTALYSLKKKLLKATQGIDIHEVR